MTEPKHMKAGDTGNSWVTRSRLFKYREEIRHEIDLHKWYESEKAGYDIGWERAATDWLIRHGTQFRPGRGA